MDAIFDFTFGFGHQLFSQRHDLIVGEIRVAQYGEAMEISVQHCDVVVARFQLG